MEKFSYASFLCSADPCVEPPFAEGSPARQGWERATVDAEAKISDLQARALRDSRAHVDRIPEIVAGFWAECLGIWAARSVGTVVSQETAEKHIEWMFHYAEAIEESVLSKGMFPRHLVEPPLRSMLAEQLAHCRAETYRLLARGFDAAAGPGQDTASMGGPEDPAVAEQEGGPAAAGEAIPRSEAGRGEETVEQRGVRRRLELAKVLGLSDSGLTIAPNHLAKGIEIDGKPAFYSDWSAANNYLNGTTKSLRDSTRINFAKTLGVKPGDLPR